LACAAIGPPDTVSRPRGNRRSHYESHAFGWIAYAAAKFGVEGWIESLTLEVAPFSIRTMLVEPGFFRTDLLTPQSTNYAKPTIDDYAERTARTVAAWNSMNGQQGGDPA
jgi:NAD(P)-dependent dehydrogenase (short-subunit alcohol dehydrogenase family)